MPTKSNLKTCSICARHYAGRQCPECYTARGAPVQNTAALLGQGEPVAGPRPGDTVRFEDEPGVVFAVQEVRFNPAGQLIALVQAPGQEPEWCYVAGWR